MIVKVSNGDAIQVKCCDTYITIPQEVYYELMAYVEHYDTEVSGCGMVERLVNVVGDNDSRISEVEYRVTEIFLPKEQKNSGASSNIDSNAVHSLMNELLRENKDTSKLKFHWHSHVNMGVFHSGTDEDNYNTLCSGEYLVSIVMNKKGDILGRIDVYDKARIVITNVPVYTYIPDVSDTTKDKIKRNTDLLDKFMEEHKSKEISVCGGYGSREYSYNDPWDESIINGKDSKGNDKLNCMVHDKELEKEKQRARSILKISKKITDRIDKCTSWACLKCEIEQECKDYSYYVYGVEKGGGGRKGYDY